MDELLEFKEETKFPWLLSNVIDNTTGKRLAEGEESLLLEWGGRKVGELYATLDEGGRIVEPFRKFWNIIL